MGVNNALFSQTLLEKLKTLYSEIEGLPPDRIVPTVGLNIGRAEAYKAKLIFWDLGGQVCAKKGCFLLIEFHGSVFGVTG